MTKIQRDVDIINDNNEKVLSNGQSPLGGQFYTLQIVCNLYQDKINMAKPTRTHTTNDFIPDLANSIDQMESR